MAHHTKTDREHEI